MSYCRWSDGDLYIIHAIHGFLECICCDMEGTDSFCTTSRSEMIGHIEKHRKKGHKVQQRAIDRLIKEIKEKGDKV